MVKLLLYDPCLLSGIDYIYAMTTFTHSGLLRTCILCQNFLELGEPLNEQDDDTTTENICLHGERLN